MLEQCERNQEPPLASEVLLETVGLVLREAFVALLLVIAVGTGEKIRQMICPRRFQNVSISEVSNEREQTMIIWNVGWNVLFMSGGGLRAEFEMFSKNRESSDFDGISDSILLFALLSKA